MQRLKHEIPDAKLRTAVLGLFLQEFADLTSNREVGNTTYTVASASHNIGFGSGTTQNSGISGPEGGRFA